MSEELKENMPKTNVSANGKGKETNQNTSTKQIEEPVENPTETITESDEQAVETEPEKKRLPFYIIGGVVIVGAIFGTLYWLNARHFDAIICFLAVPTAFLFKKVKNAKPPPGAH